MPILDCVPAAEPSRTPTRTMLTLAKKAVSAFSTSFPNIEYDVLWSSRTANAQAWWEEKCGRVRVYGGLACQPALKFEGWLIVLAHETGHLLGGAPYSNHVPDLSCECQADNWAITRVLPHVVGGKSVKTLVRKGMEQLSGIFTLPPEQSNRTQPRGHRLCHLDFCERQRRLLTDTRQKTRIVRTCHWL